jgi:hypothetical protein
MSDRCTFALKLYRRCLADSTTEEGSHPYSLSNISAPIRNLEAYQSLPDPFYQCRLTLSAMRENHP